ncbi:BTAD domain-containing putative transcriptional regulator [Heyndrickxia sporothermodurans]
MNDQFPIVETKLRPPMVKKIYIRRSQMMKKLGMIKNYPLTIIHSGAGYGKSTALSLFMYDIKPNFCWYTISSNDDDVLPFITYIIYSLRKRYHLFGKELMNYISKMEKYIRDDEINTLCALFINEITQIENETILVLDDYHLVDHSFTINMWMERVIEHLPNHFHIIISSRVMPKWKLLTKWRVSGKLLEIDEHQLTLTADEVEILFHDFYGISLTSSNIQAVYQLTEGWIIAISMVAEQLSNGATLSSVLNYQHSSMEGLFHYLAMEVFTKQSPIIQSFIEQASIFEEMTPKVCNEVLGIQGSEMMLEQLANHNAFLHKLADSYQYRFHALFKASVERRFKQEQYPLYKQLHERSARYYESNGQWEQAITHYEKIQYFEAIGALLEKCSDDMLKNGKLESFYERLKNLPDAIKNYYHSLWFYEGEVLRYLSYYEKAKNCYQSLIEQSTLKNDWRFIGRGYEGMAQIYLDTIQPGKAERYLYLAIDLMEKHLGRSHSDVKKLYGLMAENLVNSGQAVKAEKWFEKGELHSHVFHESNLDARMFLRTGNLNNAKKTLINRIESDGRSLPQTHRETEILLSFIEVCMGNGQEAKRLAQIGIEQGIKWKNPFVEACGWMRLGHATQIIDEYDSMLAEQCYRTSLNMMEQVNIPRGKAEPYMGLCILYGRKGEFEKAHELGRMALYETEKVHDLWLSSFIQLCMGIASFYGNRNAEAESYFYSARENFHQCGDQYGMMMANLWSAFLYDKSNDEKLFTEAISTFLQETQLGNYEFIFSQNSPFGPYDLQAIIPLLIKARDKGIHSSFVHKILKEIGYEELESHPGYTLKVITFGEMKIWLSDIQIEEKDWQRMKAKELFQFLLVKKGKWWSKEEIYQELWPDIQSKNVDQEFKVILNSLNKTLEPNRKVRAAPFYILRKQNAYRFNPKAAIDCDFVQFEQWIQEGLREKSPEKAKAILLKGLDLYRGEFLIDKRDEVWVITERERFHTLFLRGAEKLAQVFVRTRGIEEAINWCEKILSIDPSWEEAYRLLMYCHYQKNNRPQAIKYYISCKKVLAKEFGVEPMEATKNMYEMILAAEEIDTL